MGEDDEIIANTLVKMKKLDYVHPTKEKQAPVSRAYEFRRLKRKLKVEVQTYKKQ